MITVTLANGTKQKVYSPIIKSLQISADNVINGIMKRGGFTGAIHYVC